MDNSSTFYNIIYAIITFVSVSSYFLFSPLKKKSSYDNEINITSSINPNNLIEAELNSDSDSETKSESDAKTKSESESKLTNEVVKSQIDSINLSQNSAKSTDVWCNYESDPRYCINESNYYLYHNILFNDNHSMTFDFSKIKETKDFITYFFYSSNFNGDIRYVSPNGISHYSIDSNQYTQQCYKITIDTFYNFNIKLINVSEII